MADTHETIADIIAEMRRNFADGNPYYAAGLPDRLEAAHKRDTKELRVEIERLKEERNYSGVRERERLRANGFAIVPKEQLERGDCAKLREALKAIGGLCTGLMPTWDGAIGRIKDMAEAALSTPPRNCDRFSVAAEALAEWQRLAHMKPNTWDFRYNYWLFAPATEKEGGAK